MSEYPKKRRLDCSYFRVERYGKFDFVCFTDLTEEEQEKVCAGRSTDWLIGLVMHLAECLRGIGDEFYLEDDAE